VLFILPLAIGGPDWPCLDGRVPMASSICCNCTWPAFRIVAYVLGLIIGGIAAARRNREQSVADDLCALAGITAVARCHRELRGQRLNRPSRSSTMWISAQPVSRFAPLEAWATVHATFRMRLEDHSI